MKGTKVLLMGGGGREHALAWALRRSGRVDEVVCAPGNGGIARLARCVAVDGKSLDDMLRVIAAEQPDLVVVGPELPLSLGLVDSLRTRSVPVFGPTQAAARLETSKSFAKQFMQRYGIPTARYTVCASAAEALEALELFSFPVVIKADGLQAGKGVLIAEERAEAERAITGLFSGALLGSAEQSVVVEEFLDGEELSLLLVSDGTHVTPLVPAQDHKRVGDGDKGPNTGGMGAYSTDTLVSAEMRSWILEHIAKKTVDGMALEGTPFVGVLYLGLMMTATGPMVLEYNTRFGDPETQAIVMRLESDLLEGMLACVEGRLSDTEFKWKPGASACVVAATGGYPGSYRTGDVITGLNEVGDGVQVFHAGTTFADGVYRTAGGRVLSVAAAGHSLSEALILAYQGLERVRFEGMQYRHDIGGRAIKGSSLR